MQERSAAIVGFLFHAPGLRLAGKRLPPALLRANAVALAMTVVAIAAASPFGWRVMLGAWVAGHFAWSAYLARAVLRGALSDGRGR